MKPIDSCRFAMLLLLLLMSCSSVRRFQASTSSSGGYDTGGDGDQLYFLIRNMSGFEDGAYGLVLPSDWSRQASRESADGILELEEPVAWNWKPADQLTPPAEYRPLPTWTSGPIVGAGLQSIDLLVIEQDGQFEPDRIWQDIVTRLEVGASAYVLVRTKEQGEHRVVIYGAKGPPLKWVRIGSLSWTDQRGGFERSADVLVRQSGVALDWTFYAAGHLWWIALFFL